MNKIILVSGNLDPNNSYEYHNFLKPLENMGKEVLPFDFKKIMDVYYDFISKQKIKEMRTLLAYKKIWHKNYLKYI